MKIICTRSSLMQGINTVSKAVPAKTTMNILQCILIECESNTIRLTANDMELGIETVIDGDILQEGTIALEARLFSEIIRKLPDSDITIDTDETFHATIRCEKAVFTVAGLSGLEFVRLPEVEAGTGVTLSQFTVKELIRQTIFSIADNDSNKMMTGELFEITGDRLKVVSLDGHRVSIRNVTLKESYDVIKSIIPGKTLNELSKILTGGSEDEIRITFTRSHVLFVFDRTKVVSRVIEGEYFQLSRMLSGDYETKLTVNKQVLTGCLERALLLVREGDKKPVILTIHDEDMAIRMTTLIGTMNEDIEISKQGRDLMIGLNPKFVLDALRVIDEEMIDLYMVNAKSPVFIRDEQMTYTYLILPVNFAAVN